MHKLEEVAECSTDPRTGRRFGDHGTAEQAIDFALAGNNEAWTQETEFLRCWRTGDLDEWTEFYPWLARQEAS